MADIIPVKAIRTASDVTALGEMVSTDTIAATLVNINGATEINAALVDSDEIPVYDASATANRKSLLSRIWTYISGKMTATANVFTARQEARLTTEQLRLGYDATKYASFTTQSDGALALGINGTERFKVTDTGGIQIARTAVTAPATADGNIYSGTYTPTLTNVTNVAASTASECQYMRVGNVVSISGQFIVQVTTGGSAFTLGISLPIASDFAAQRNAGGSFGSGSATLTANFIVADSTNDRLSAVGICSDTTSRTYAFHVTYRII